MASLLSDLKDIPRDSKILLAASSSWLFTTGLVKSWQSLYLSLFGGYLLVGALATISIGLGLLLSYAGGHLGTAFSEKRVLVASISIAAVGYTLFALATTLELLVIGAILMSFTNLGAPCFNSLYFGGVQRERRGLASGLMTVAMNSAYFAAPIVSTHLLLSMLGFVGMMRVGLLLAALCFALNGALLTTLLRPTRRAGSELHQTRPRGVLLEGLQATRRAPQALKLLLTVAILEGVGYSISSTYEIFVITQIVGVSLEFYSIALLIYGLAYIPLALAFGRYADQGGRWRCALGFLVFPFVSLGLILSRGFWQLLFILLFGAVGVAAWMQAKYPLITDLTPRESLASVFSVFMTLPGLFALLAPLLGSLLLMAFPLEWLWLIEIAIYGIASILLLQAYRSQKGAVSLNG